jgi:hypothetical protein
MQTNRQASLTVGLDQNRQIGMSISDLNVFKFMKFCREKQTNPLTIVTPESRSA